MTFTKKASGEMSIRMMKKIDELCDDESSGDVEFWIIVRRHLTKLNITTISSFCHKLIAQGFFKNLDTDVQILSAVEFKNKISNLFNQWFVSKNNSLGQVFESNSQALIKAMIEIYQSPELRMIWKEPLIKTSAEAELKAFIKVLSQEFQLESLFEYRLPSDVDKKEQTKGWYPFLQSLQEVVLSHGSISHINFKHYLSWAMNSGSLPRETKAMTDEQKAILKSSKEFVSKLRDIEEDFTNFIDNYDVYWKWVEIYQDLFFFIDRNYFQEKGYTFSDLEYFTCLGLKNQGVLASVKKNYDYFIVDEFQDTSSIQYEILKSLIGEKHNQLFCVGDKKQAIYGFRGGELLVFSQCAEMLGSKNSLSLKYNFRSYGNVINFNNAFFKLIFPLGIGFDGFDSHSVLMEEQEMPESKSSLGEVVKVKAMIQGLEEAKGIDCDLYEAEALYKVTKDLLSREDIESVCILYRRLKPSSYLLEILARENIPFSAQVKVQYGEDPVINLFMRCLELSLNRNDDKKIKSTYFLLNNLVQIIGLFKLKSEYLKRVGEGFLKDLDIVGLRLAFHKFVFSLGLSNSLYQDNSQLIDSICRVCNEEPVLVYNLLATESDENYSLELMSGPRAKRIIIMSAHASKGLEFDAVCLGGIHTNGTQKGKTESVGKLPKSFKWKKVFNQKNFYKSPMYYIEADLDKAKDFSESKRLLYVANTRAVKYLAWIDLNLEKADKEVVPLSTTGSHWIKAMRMISHEEAFYTEVKMDLHSSEKFISQDAPLILKDPMGLLVNSKDQKLGLFAETSVTKLAQLSQCPFKFYLSNICKINPPNDNQKYFNSFDESDVSEEIGTNHFYSTKERGTNIHKTLSDLLLDKLEVTKISEKKDLEKILWAYAQAKEIKQSMDVISEKLIKFSFFGQMISGTPDLIFTDENNVIVWDFKTGLQDESSEENYWFQLMCYGYAYAKLKHFGPEKMIPLSLVYIDEMKVVTKTMSFHEMNDILFENWSKTEFLNQVNTQHCQKCEYSSICCHAINS